MAKIDTKTPPSEADKRAYWRSAKRLTIGLLIVWFAVSYGAGILFRDALDAFSIGGAPLGFWFAQNGSIYVFLILIVVYCVRMTQLETKHGIRG
jgi:putative solute:sodium symporter small subunit